MKANIILWLMRWLNKHYIDQIKNYPHINPYKFEGLTPYIEEDKDKHYEDSSTKALEKALSDPEIKNIAVTGSFGAGKSSFLRSFEHHHKWWNYVNISLATFTSKEEGNRTNKNQLIERSILQQLLYKVKKEKIPQSQFNKIQKIYFLPSLLPIAIFLGWFSSYIIIFHKETAKKLLLFQELNIPKLCSSFVSINFCNSLVVIVFFTTNLILLWWIHKYLSSFRITKLTSKGDIDITKVSETNSESFLNKNLDEIMYFFEATPYDVVVIEDLDRSKNPEIFIKLREINELINKSDQIEGTVKFIYAIKDEIFTGEERTKFFDFIIPIIPIINRSNSYAIISKKLPSYSCKDDFQKLLKEVSQYIEDMRLLINIVNEFKVYEEKVNSQVDPKKLFAMIVYKNMFPADFSSLHKNKGVLCNIFKKKNSYIQKSITTHEKKIKEIELQIEEIENLTDWVTDLNELRAIYIQKIFERYKLNHSATIKNKNGQSVSLTEGILNKNIFEIIRKESKITHIIPVPNNVYNNQNHSMSQEIEYNFAEVETLVNKTHGYYERETVIKEKHKAQIIELKEKIEDLEKDKRRIVSSNLNELIKKNEINDLFEEETSRLIGIEQIKDKVKDFNNNILLFRYFIRNEYIDQYFLNYVSYFHEGGVKLRDHEFLLQVRDQKSLPFSHSIENAKEVINELNLEEFRNSTILNFDIVEELVLNQHEHSEKLNLFVTLLSNKNHKDVTDGFIQEFFEFTNNKDLFINLVIKTKLDFLDFVLNHKEFSDSKKEEYLAAILKSSKVEEILNLNKNNNLKNHLENKIDFLKFEEKFDLISIRDKTKELFKNLSIKFKDLGKVDKNNELAKYIFNYDHYQLNPKNISKIIYAFNEDSLPINFQDQLDEAHLTSIKELNLEVLSVYIDENIETYIKDCFLVLENNNKESSDTIIELLNNEDIALDLRKEIIRKAIVTFSDISIVKEEGLWEELLDHNNVEPTWENVLTFYKKEQNEGLEDE